MDFLLSLLDTADHLLRVFVMFVICLSLSVFVTGAILAVAALWNWISRKTGK
jgi:hypothetical protein